MDITTDGIKKMLAKLADYQAQVDVLNLQKQDLIDKVLTPEIKAQLDDIEAEFKDKSAAVTENMAVLDKEIREVTLAHGATVKDDELQAVWVKGRTGWNTDALEGYAVDHPDILRFRTVGKPSISIRKVS